jgi:hypothetical protein
MMLLCALVINVQSQLIYPCDSIPVHLRAGAKAVVRSAQRRITIINEKQSRFESKVVITLLNDEAGELLMVGIPYDDLRRVSGIRACAYDESGKLIWTLRNYNIQDKRDFSGPEKLSDARKKVFEIPSFNYPFTIEYGYLLNIEDLFLSPAVYLQLDPEIAVEESGLQYVIPAGSAFTYKTQNLKSPTDSVHIKNKVYLSWKEENIPASRQRKYATSNVQKLPVVYATPIDFDLRGYKGSFHSWKEYGSWMGQLISGRDILDPIYSEKVQSLVKYITDRREKIKILYEYFQKNTHYYYIGFGIGGNQPMPASEVAKYGYGDCKALSNYMKALLKTVGIESYYTLVRSGSGKSIRTDIPCNQFDHVILCIPDENDTIWLECTDPASPFDYLGSFTGDREVLAITPEGGKLLRTPSYGSAVNIARTFADIVLLESGDAEIKLEIEKSGLLYNEIFNLSAKNPDERKKWLANQLGYSAFDVKREEYAYNRNEHIPSARASYELRFRDLAARSSKMLFVAPTFISGLTYMVNEPGEIELDMAFQQKDSVRIEIPSGYLPDYLPEEKQITTRFGSYSRHLTTSGNYVYFTRRLSFNKAIYPRAAYPDFYHFISDMATLDKEVLVLKSIY